MYAKHKLQILKARNSCAAYYLGCIQTHCILKLLIVRFSNDRPLNRKIPVKINKGLFEIKASNLGHLAFS